MSSLATWSNTARGREIEIPSATIHANARSLATLGSHWIGGGCKKIISQRTMDEALSEPQNDFDPFLSSSYSFTKGGFCHFNDFSSKLVSPNFASDFHGFYGWGGKGGSWMIFHPERKISIAYAMNGLAASSLGGPRSDRIMSAVQKVLKRIV
jgi:hypothetical protein